MKKCVPKKENVQEKILHELHNINRRMHKMSKALDDLNAKVDALNDVVASLKAGIDNIAAEIQTLISGGSGATQTQLEQLSAKVDTITAATQADVDQLKSIDPTP